MAAPVTIRINLNDVTIRTWCTHDDGTTSWRVTNTEDTIDVFLRGTPAQLEALATTVASEAFRTVLYEAAGVRHRGVVA